MAAVEVATSAGRVRGRWEDGVAVFRGIPFAAPPVGPNRFTAPAPVTPWVGVRDAARFGPPPPQPGRPTGDDDWLTLAVWTPDPGRAGLPVMVWISGGGYLACDSADPYLPGGTLAAAGAVVVSAHYRSGAEGFLHLDGAPGPRRRHRHRDLRRTRTCPHRRRPRRRRTGRPRRGGRDGDGPAAAARRPLGRGGLHTHTLLARGRR